MKQNASVLLAVAVLIAALSSGAGSASAQVAAFPVPSGKDSAAVAAVFARHMRAATVAGRPDTSRFMHTKQLMEVQGSPPAEMELFIIRGAPGTKNTARVRSVMNMPMMGMMETVVNRSIGWVMSPGQTPTLLEPSQIDGEMMGASPNPLANLPSGKLTMAGKETIDGREMQGVRMTDTLGTDAIMFFDTKTGLASAVRTGAMRGMTQDTSIVMLMGDYKPFNGALMPTTMTVRQGPMQSMTMRVVQMESTPFDTMMFVPPPAVVEMLKLKKP